MKITGKDITRAQAEDVRRKVNRCLRVLSKKDYDLGFDYKQATRIADTVLHVYTRANGRSRAGAYQISICLNSQSMMSRRGWFCEYKSFEDDPTIGSVRVGSYDEALWCLVAHEVSHHVQFRYVPGVPRLWKLSHAPHGDRFKYCYRILRRDLVNPIIAERAAGNGTR